MIFSRKRAERHAGDERSTEVLEDLQAEETASPVSGRGPYDISEAPSDVARLDLGSLHIPAIADVEVRVQADQQGVVQQVVLVHGQNALQLGVFAAPKSEGIWDEVREEIRQSLLADGAATQEVEGEYGPELRAQVRTPDGPTDLRFVGIDGPRWMVRGVFQGAAAVDPVAAGPLAVCLEGLVVDRGQEAKPVREPLPLRLPREATDESAAANPDGGRPTEQPRQV
ncbi:DUF3710 domain-containing protein [Micromonospora musae]|uniref:DUF3710 domain-containing protein n=1 Tax=Micromonospora musae TaxID=1894970 RepID=UPI0034184E92